jgi:hypothetical protein
MDTVYLPFWAARRVARRTEPMAVPCRERSGRDLDAGCRRSRHQRPDCCSAWVQPRTGPEALGWENPLEAYRPFLSYNELGSLLDEGPPAPAAAA